MSGSLYLPGVKSFDLSHLVADAVDLLVEMEPEFSYYGCFSGGKDSVVIKELARISEVRVEWYYNVTTIDPPELVRFIRQRHPDVLFDRPVKPFFQRMVEKGYPTRRSRWCCSEFKESKPPKGATLILGIRGDESKRRASTWSEVTYRTKTRTSAVLPILRWRKDHIWEFIKNRGLAYCSLYDEGFDRLGCIGCPMARAAGRRKQFERWPQYEKLWRNAFRDLWARRVSAAQKNGREWSGSARFSSWEDLFLWWASDESYPKEQDCLQRYLF